MTANKLTNPTDIARETLKQLAVRRIAPTPERYEELYHEIAGIKPVQADAGQPLVAELVKTLKAMPRQTPDLLRQVSHLENAAQDKDWAAIPNIVVQAIESQGGQATLIRSWTDLIRELIQQWDMRSPHFSSARKQESLTKVLLNFGNYQNLLNEKLDALIRSWAEGARGVDGVETPPEVAQPAPIEGLVDEAAIAASANSSDTASSTLGDGTVAVNLDDWQRWREALAQALRMGVCEQLKGHPELVDEAASLAQAAEAVASSHGLEFLAGRLKKFWGQLNACADQESRLTTGLLNLLLLLNDNLGALSGSDEWVQGQVAVIRDLLSKPLSVNRLYDVEAAFKEIVYKQNVLKESLEEAQGSLKKMVSLFIDRLGGMVDSTGEYQHKIDTYAGRIERANAIDDLKSVIDELMQDTRVMQLDMTRSRDDLLEARNQAETAGNRIVELERELRAISEKIREDQLTGALNRRGFKEAFDMEMARAARSDSGKSLCVALLDIDNFKKLNDQQGHQAGDDALIHLVNVIKDVLRPVDVIARYGGEEFVVLMPETMLNDAATVMRRVQRELTKRFFLHNNERVLITFSAGVTRYLPEESQEEVIERADSAMYEAKKAGKNQVIVSDPINTASRPDA